MLAADIDQEDDFGDALGLCAPAQARRPAARRASPDSVDRERLDLDIRRRRLMVAGATSASVGGVKAAGVGVADVVAGGVVAASGAPDPAGWCSEGSMICSGRLAVSRRTIRRLVRRRLCTFAAVAIASCPVALAVGVRYVPRRRRAASRPSAEPRAPEVVAP